MLWSPRKLCQNCFTDTEKKRITRNKIKKFNMFSSVWQSFANISAFTVQISSRISKLTMLLLLKLQLGLSKHYTNQRQELLIFKKLLWTGWGLNGEWGISLWKMLIRFTGRFTDFLRPARPIAI